MKNREKKKISILVPGVKVSGDNNEKSTPIFMTP
jgi:hypothetical protein